MKLNNLHHSEIPAEFQNHVPGRGDLRIVLTTKCNLTCSHCHNEGNLPPWSAKGTAASVDQVHDLLSVAARHGTRSVKFTGGDPAVHASIRNILELVTDWRTEFATIERWGITTNGIAFLKPPYFKALVRSALDNICIGIDSLLDGERSKPSSLKGILGAKLFEQFVLPLARAWPDRSIKINVVFDGNFERVERVIDACVENKLNVSVIEVNGVMGNRRQTRDAFSALYEKTKSRYSATEKYNAELNELSLAVPGHSKKIAFYQDHCADLDCGHCRNIHMRVSPGPSGWSAIPCFLQDQDAGYSISRDEKVDTRAFLTAANLNGRGPAWAETAERYETRPA